MIYRTFSMVFLLLLLHNVTLKLRAILQKEVHKHFLNNNNN